MIDYFCYYQHTQAHIPFKFCIGEHSVNLVIVKGATVQKIRYIFKQTCPHLFYCTGTAIFDVTEMEWRNQIFVQPQITQSVKQTLHLF